MGRDHDELILIGLGSNLPGAAYKSPLAVCQAALGTLARRGISLCRRSRWYVSAPVPPSDQPWYVNAVIAVETRLAPQALLDALLAIEASIGRRRRVRWAARVLDLDLIAYKRRVVTATGPEAAIVPHPRFRERAFVLKPLAEIAPTWIDPGSGKPIGALLAECPRSQFAAPLTASIGT